MPVLMRIENFVMAGHAEANKYSHRWPRVCLFLVVIATTSFGQIPAATQATATTRYSGPQTIHPGELWPDDRGQHIQAHGGGIIRLADDTPGALGPGGAAGFTYYWFGEERSQSFYRRSQRARLQEYTLPTQSHPEVFNCVPCVSGNFNVWIRPSDRACRPF